MREGFILQCSLLSLCNDSNAVKLLPRGPKSVCCWAPGFCCSGKAGASFLAAAAAGTPGRHAPAAAVSADAPTDAALQAACAYTPEQRNTTQLRCCSPQTGPKSNIRQIIAQP